MPTYLSPGVYVEEVATGARPIEGVGTSVAAFVGMAQSGPVNEAVLVTNWSQFVQTFGGPMEGSYLGHSVYGYFLNGGGTCYVIRVGGDRPSTPARAEIPTLKDKAVAGLQVRALDPGPAGNQVRVEVMDATEPGEDKSPDTFKLIVKGAPGQPEEVYDNVSARRGKDWVVPAVKTQSKLIAIEETGPANLDRAPARVQVQLTGFETGKPMRVTPEDYEGSPADRTGFGGLEAVDAVTMLAAPDLMAMYQAGQIDLEGVQAVQSAMLTHCEKMGDRVALLDTPPGLSAQQVGEWRTDKVRYDSKFGTLYWPWIRIFDPVAGEGRYVPPSGHVAGVWARSDEERGVHKAPANEVLRGVLALELAITKDEHGQLNPAGINCIRAFAGRGIRIWGARTLSSDPAWRYLNVRRLFNYVEESILEGTQWVVFEPNDLDLWQRVRRTITAFLTRVWRDGALFGSTPEEAFYVKCDAETNPPEVIDAGQLVVEVGIAPVKPAEFVIFRIAQYSGGAAVSE
jgi:hypothetical protein